jgi:hypothetical protein
LRKETMKMRDLQRKLVRDGVKVGECSGVQYPTCQRQCCANARPLSRRSS